MKFSSFISSSESTENAVEQVLAAAQQDATPPDALFVFFTAEHAEQADELIEKLWLQLDPQVAIGCSAEGVIGADQEIERSPGLSILIANLPDVRIHPFHIAGEDWERLLSDGDAIRERLGFGDETRALLGFGDPYTSPMNQFLPLLDEVAPSSPLIGGMAS